MLSFICVCIFMCAHFLFHSICLPLREIWLHLIRMRFCQHYSSNGPNPLAKKNVCKQDSVLGWPKKRFVSANALLSDETSLSQSKNHIFIVPTDIHLREEYDCNVEFKWSMHWIIYWNLYGNLEKNIAKLKINVIILHDIRRTEVCWALSVGVLRGREKYWCTAQDIYPKYVLSSWWLWCGRWCCC